AGRQQGLVNDRLCWSEGKARTDSDSDLELLGDAVSSCRTVCLVGWDSLLDDSHPVWMTTATVRETTMTGLAEVGLGLPATQAAAETGKLPETPRQRKLF